ncbi:hypothetical protein [Paludisphaera sp.]|uniref:hypothetical protein n=1 Tax=Paludisphaera sp. TaxID=2017432 RepID=UPI00301DF859
MSQAEVRSIDALRDFRAALALYGEDVLAALGAVDAEIRRTVQWLQQDRPYFWQEQIKRRRERVAAARADLFRLKLQKTPEHHPSLAEPKERLRQAEAALADAERRLMLTRKWQPALHLAVIEYHGTVQRLKDAASADVPRAMALLTRIVEALEAYLQVQPPDGRGAEAARATPAMESIARDAIDRDDEEGPSPAAPEEAP